MKIVRLFSFCSALLMMLCLGVKAEAAITLTATATIVNLNATQAQVTLRLFAGASAGTQTVSTYGLTVTSSSGTWSSANTTTVGAEWASFDKTSSVAGNVATFRGGMPVPVANPSFVTVSTTQSQIGEAVMTVARNNQTISFNLGYTTTLNPTVNPNPTVGILSNTVSDTYTTITTTPGNGGLLVTSAPISAVPEPTSLLLAGLAVGGFGVRRRFLLRKKA